MPLNGATLLEIRLPQLRDLGVGRRSGPHREQHVGGAFQDQAGVVDLDPQLLARIGGPR
ncbi:hypothetical protein GS462_25950, partial [Rhodococcus hoagii]|nr:hypothetical protein [Prescottella equi]